MKKILLLIFILVQGKLWAQSDKAPAYPLIVHDPYFSIWSFSDTLTSTPTKHWTGADQPLTGLVKVDGKLFRFMGNKSMAYQTVIPTAEEKPYDTRYTETEPSGNWMNTAYDDKQWKNGKAPFGNNERRVQTQWKSNNLWVRRTFDLASADFNKLYLLIILVPVPTLHRAIDRRLYFRYE